MSRQRKQNCAYLLQNIRILDRNALCGLPMLFTGEKGRQTDLRKSLLTTGIDQQFTCWNSEACGEDETKLLLPSPQENSFKVALFVLEGRREEGQLCFVFIQVFDNLPQEEGTRTDKPNQQIATRMSNLVFCPFDMTHMDNISINRGQEEYNILSTTRPMTHTVHTLKPTVVSQEKASNWFLSFVRYEHLYPKKPLHSPTHAPMSYNMKGTERKKYVKKATLDLKGFIFFHTRLYSRPLPTMGKRKSEQPEYRRPSSKHICECFLQIKQYWRFDHGSMKFIFTTAENVTAL